VERPAADPDLEPHADLRASVDRRHVAHLDPGDGDRFSVDQEIHPANSLSRAKGRGRSVDAKREPRAGEIEEAAERRVAVAARAREAGGRARVLRENPAARVALLAEGSDRGTVTSSALPRSVRVEDQVR
jgi:hypothetical protein